MSSWVVPFIVVVVVVDVVLMWWIFAKRRTEAFGGMTFIEFQKFSSKANVMIREHMRAHYHGDVSKLSEVLPDLLARINSHALSSGIMLERSNLKRVVGRLIAMQRIAGPADMDKAMKQIA